MTIEFSHELVDPKVLVNSAQNDTPCEFFGWKKFYFFQFGSHILCESVYEPKGNEVNIPQPCT